MLQKFKYLKLVGTPENFHRAHSVSPLVTQKRPAVVSETYPENIQSINYFNKSLAAFVKATYYSRTPKDKAENNTY